MLSFRRLTLQKAASQDRRTEQKEKQIEARALLQMEEGEQIGGLDVFPAVVDAVVEDVGEVKVGQEARNSLVNAVGKKGTYSQTVPRKMRIAASAEKWDTSS